MSVFKLIDCDFGVTIKGVSYDFVHVQGLTLEDNEKVRLIRGGNAGNKTGISYAEGVREAKVLTVTVIGMDTPIYTLLRDAFKNRERVECYTISRTDGSSKIAKNSVLSQMPQQLTIDETAESMNVALIFETFDIEEKHKT